LVLAVLIQHDSYNPREKSDGWNAKAGEKVEVQMGDDDQWWSLNYETWTWPFGKCLGLRLDETPLDYLEWIAKNFSKGPYKKAAKREIARRDPSLAKSLKIAVDEPGGVQGRYDCSHMYDPHREFPDCQPWDGITAPWLDQMGDDDLSREYRQIVS